jgi:hypothetical protein
VATENRTDSVTTFSQPQKNNRSFAEGSIPRGVSSRRPAARADGGGKSAEKRARALLSVEPRALKACILSLVSIQLRSYPLPQDSPHKLFAYFCERMRTAIVSSILLISAWQGQSFTQQNALCSRPSTFPRGRASSSSSSTPLLQVSTQEDQAIDVKAEGINNESPRLSKAKQLLEQFTLDTQNDERNNNGRPARAAGGSNATRSMPVSVSIAPAATSSNNLEASSSDYVVPDQYWSNGHLQGGNYVTRWARGVKVAEPLVKYDPVAAEKLLFRQPTKWLVRNTQIAFPMGLWAAGVVSDYLMGVSTENRRQRAKQLLNAITNLGPVRVALLLVHMMLLLYRCAPASA